MTTIFIKNVTKLVSAKLKVRWSELNAQLTAADVGPFKCTPLIHNTQLSTEQAQIIDDLEKDIIKFVSSTEDKNDKERIKSLIAHYKKKVERVREAHDAKSTSGTLECLDKLNNAVEGFYIKLQDFNFPLLDREDLGTPEYVVYDHACYYLGLSLFDPHSHSSMEIKKNKDEALYKRLAALENAIRAEYNIEQQKTITLQTLQDLARDNQDIVKPKKMLSVPVLSTGFTFLGMPLKAQTASTGRLGQQIILAENMIKALTQEQFDLSRSGQEIATISTQKPLSARADEGKETGKTEARINEKASPAGAVKNVEIKAHEPLSAQVDEGKEPGKTEARINEKTSSAGAVKGAEIKGSLAEELEVSPEMIKSTLQESQSSQREEVQAQAKEKTSSHAALSLLGQGKAGKKMKGKHYKEEYSADAEQEEQLSLATP